MSESTDSSDTFKAPVLLSPSAATPASSAKPEITIKSVMNESTDSSDAFKAPVLPPLSIATSASSAKPEITLKSVMNESIDSSDAFKAPVLPPPSVATPVSSAKPEMTLKSKKDLSKPKETVALPYQEPEWKGIPPPKFSLEIIKNGTVVSNLPLRSSYIVFGRLAECDVAFEHPSVSRYHAILQYSIANDRHDEGFYLYDLGSTHGTFLNKVQIKSKIYYKLKVGYVLKFGGSSRLHILQGPEEEEEVVKKEKKEEKSEEVCSWGIAEDAEEDEELSEINPFALSVTNEELYIDDPKKTLRGWFEREGYELEYKCEEKGYQTFLCTVRLPVDTPTGEYLTVEASVKGKKKEAVIACALEACRTLDRMGLLRQAQHESKQKKRKNWEENDYYDSDEDTFYDRSGEIEKRREMRKRLANKKSETENFQTLETKLKILNEEIDSINSKLSVYTAKTTQVTSTGEEDSLESYMSGLEKANDVPKDKFEKRRLMLRLTEAEKEKSKLEKMLNIARPAKLPPIAKHPGMIGRRFKSKLNLPMAKPKEQVKPVCDDKDEEEDEEEEKDDEKDNSSNKDSVEMKDVSEKDKLMTECSNEPLETKEPITELSNKPPETKKPITEFSYEPPEMKETITEFSNESTPPKTYGLILPKKDELSSKQSRKPSDTDNKILASTGEPKTNVSDSDKMEQDPVVDSSSSKEPSVPAKHHKRNRHKKPKAEVDVYKTQNDDYCTWTPPSNQSGDGMTHLNAKFGY